MKKYILINLAVLICSSNYVYAQKIVSEGTITYNILIQNSDKGNVTKDSASTIIYLKGNLSRTDMINSLGSETTVFNAKSNTAFILKQYSGQKLMITLSKDDWEDKYNKYNGIVFTPTAETKEIGGYVCKKALAQLKNGTTFFVYYTPDISVINKEYDPVFKNLPGFPVQYEFTNGKLSFQYTITSINLNAVPAARFEVPRSGYRIMTYGESKQ